MVRRWLLMAVAAALGVVLVAGALTMALRYGRQPEAPPPQDNAVRAQRVVDALRLGDYAAVRACFDDMMRAALTETDLRQAWTSQVEAAGAWKGLSVGGRQRIGPTEKVTIRCAFAKRTLLTEVVFDEAGRVAGLWLRPEADVARAALPPYARPDSFREEDLTVGADGLPATLTLPVGDGPFAGIVLVHGSGPNDRDETVGANKPFRDLALGLATQGIAVLRYDKRTYVKPLSLLLVQDRITTKEEVLDDAVAAIEALGKDPRIRPEWVFVLGHSLGGALAPRIARQAPLTAGLIVMAGSTRPLEDALLEQVEYIASLGNTHDGAVRVQLDALRRQVARVKDPALSPDTPAAELPLGVPATYWLDLHGYDPAATAASLKKPMLILQGKRDYQVTQDDFAGWWKALHDTAYAEFKTYPDLNHLFITGEGKSAPAEYTRPGHVAEEVINDIASWVRQQCRPAQQHP